MNEFWILWSGGLAVMLGLGVVTWLYSLVNDDVSIVDSLWSLMFLAAAFYYASSVDTLSPTTILMLVMVSLWALRLSAVFNPAQCGRARRPALPRNSRQQRTPLSLQKPLYSVRPAGGAGVDHFRSIVACCYHVTLTSA